MANFVMLIGLPGAGKTKYIEHISDELNLHNEVILSSDAIRAEIYGDEAIQTNPEKVFAIMQQRSIAALSNGNDVIYDATNISRKKRRHLLSQLPKNSVKIACVIWAKYETCVQRDASRKRTVGESVIKRMLHHFQPPYYDEGWDKIRFCYNDTPYTSKDYYSWVDCQHDNPHHNNSVAEHIHRVCSEVLSIPMENEATRRILLIAAHLHDIGKKFVKDFKDPKGNPCDIAHYYDHHNVGSYFCIGYSDVMDLHITERALITWLVNVHMEPFFNSRYYRELSGNLKHLVDLLHSCDVKGA